MEPSPDIDPMDLIRLDPELHFTTFGRIKTKRGHFVTPKPNIMQRKMFARYRDMQVQGLPTMIVNLKPRQKGSSTGAAHLCYHHMQRYANLDGVSAGNIQGTSANILDLFQRYAQLDEFPWRPEGVYADGGDLAEEQLLSNGSRQRVLTAGSKSMGRSGTVQCSHLTEVAFFERSEKSKADPALGFINSCYTEGPEALHIMESTPNGAQGYFYKMCMEALEGKGNWFFTFTAWFEFEDSVLPFAHPDLKEEFAAELTQDEEEEQKRFGVTLEQLHWRRLTLQDKCEGDIQKFRQEYPSDPIECFLSSSRPRFNAILIDELMKNAVTPKVGNMTLQENGKAQFVRDPGGLWDLWESPAEGLSYLLSVDTCTGEDQQMDNQLAPDPDFHSAQVWRAGYYDQNEVWHIPRLVASHHTRLDIGDLAIEVAAAYTYYGSPLIIPEVNGSGLALVKFLRDLHQCQVYQRRKINDSTGLEEKAFGWQTDRLTRKLIIDNFAHVTTQREVDIPCKKYIKELKTFIVNKAGKATAAAGCHDDYVLSGAIAIFNLDAATELKLPRRKTITARMAKNNPTLGCPDGFMRGTLADAAYRNSRGKMRKRLGKKRRRGR